MGVYLFALVNRTQTFQDDDFFHYALTLQLARGVFPPVTPYGVDAGVGYHYGPTLLAASIVNIAAVPAWTATVVLVSFLIAGLSFAGTGFAHDKCRSLPLGISIGAVNVLWQGPCELACHPTLRHLASSRVSLGFWKDWRRLGPVRHLHGCIGPSSPLLYPSWSSLRRRSMFELRRAPHSHWLRRRAVLALADASVMIFSSAALGLVGVLRLASLRGVDRLTLAAALLASGLLAALAGGPASDAIFRRGGTASMVRIGFEPKWAEFAPFERVGPALIQVEVVALLAIAAIAVWKRRSWGLSFLTAAGFLGLVEAVLVHSPIPEKRCSHLAHGHHDCSLHSSHSNWRPIGGPSGLLAQRGQAGNNPVRYPPDRGRSSNSRCSACVARIRCWAASCRRYGISACRSISLPTQAVSKGSW